MHFVDCSIITTWPTAFPIRRAEPELHSSSSILKQAHHGQLPPLTVRWQIQWRKMTLSMHMRLKPTAKPSTQPLQPNPTLAQLISITSQLTTQKDRRPNLRPNNGCIRRNDANSTRPNWKESRESFRNQLRGYHAIGAKAVTAVVEWRFPGRLGWMDGWIWVGFYLYKARDTLVCTGYDGLEYFCTIVYIVAHSLHFMWAGLEFGIWYDMVSFLYSNLVNSPLGIYRLIVTKFVTSRL